MEPTTEVTAPTVNYIKSPQQESIIQQYYALGKLHNANAADNTVYPEAFSFVKGKDDPKDLFWIGFEWEVIDTINRQNLVDIAKETPEFFYRVNCGADAGGMEMRSIPATLEFHKEYMQRLFFDKNRTAGFKVTKNSGQGIHIHIDKKTAFIHGSEDGGQEHLRKFIAFIVNPHNEHYIDEIAGRMFGVGASCRPRNNICKFTYYMNRRIKDCDIKFNSSLMSTTGSDKGDAVNTLANGGSSTVEVRIFNSVDNSQRFFAILEFMDALVRYSKTAMFKNMYAEDFLSWVIMNHREKYPNLLIDKSAQPLVSRIEKRLASKAKAKAKTSAQAIVQAASA